MVSFTVLCIVLLRSNKSQSNSKDSKCPHIISCGIIRVGLFIFYLFISEHSVNKFVTIHCVDEFGMVE